MLRPGQTFEGYVIDDVLGHGGYGDGVPGAPRRRPGRVVALKMLDEKHRGPAETARLRAGVRLRPPARPSARRHGVRPRRRLAHDGTGGRRHRERSLRTPPRPVDRAGADRRRARLRAPVRDRALRRQTRRTSLCRADDFSRAARCSSTSGSPTRSREDSRTRAPTPHRGVAALHGARNAARPGPRRRPPTNTPWRAPPSNWSRAHHRSPLTRAMELVDAHLHEPTAVAVAHKIDWLPRAFDSSASPRRWRRARTAATRPAPSSSPHLRP